MFDSETRWFIRCDTCPDWRAGAPAGAPDVVGGALNKDAAKDLAVKFRWQIRDDLHRCPDCVREGRTERVS